MRSLSRAFLTALCFLLAIYATYQTAQYALADQNAAPTNVGLYNYSTYTVATTTSYAVLPKNVYRAGLVIQNNGAVSVVIKPKSAPANATDGIVLIAGAILQMNPPPVDALFAQSASATAKIVFIENSK